MKEIYSNDELYKENPFLHELALSEFDVTQEIYPSVTYWLVEKNKDGVLTGVYFPCDAQGEQVSIS